MGNPVKSVSESVGDRLGWNIMILEIPLSILKHVLTCSDKCSVLTTSHSFLEIMTDRPTNETDRPTNIRDH